MRYLSVCSGIEAASAAWMPLGWQPVAFSEIEPFPTSVLAHHHPGVPNWGDMTKYKEWPDEPIDLLCGGTPCQSFSVAGLRKGLADPRGNLMLTFGAIAARYRPRWLVWENVPGVLSSNGGRDFGTFLGMLGQLGYGFAYRVLDAQYFGVAQRRRRVFVVGCLGDWRSAAAVLFERHSLQGHSAPSREARKVAPTIPSRSTAGGGLGTDFDCDGGLIAHTLRGEGFDASEDGTGRGTPLVPVAYRVHGENSTAMTGNGHARVADEVNVARCLDTSGGYASNQGGNIISHPVAYGIRTANTSSNGWGIQEEVTHTLDCAQGVAVAQPVVHAIQAGALRVNPASGPDGVGVQADHAYTLEARAEVQAVAYTTKLHNTGSNNGAQFIHCNKGRPAGRLSEHTETVAIKPLVETLTTDGHQQSAVFTPAMQVRRLTPTEAERLMGFPDGYTAIPWRNKPADQCPDGPRYKSLGNSWAVPVAAWLGKRIQELEHGRK